MTVGGDARRGVASVQSFARIQQYPHGCRSAVGVNDALVTGASEKLRRGQPKPASHNLGPGWPCNTYSTVRLLTVRLRPRKLKYLVFRDISTLAFRLHSQLTARNPREERHMNMRSLIAGFVVAEIVLNATSLVGQTLDIKPPTTGPETRPDHDQRRGEKSSVARPGVNEPHFISPFSVKTDPSQLGIAGWTSTNPNVPPGHSLSGDRAGSLGFGVAAEWGARPRSERTLIR